MLVMLNGTKIIGTKVENRTFVVSESVLLIFEPEKNASVVAQYGTLLFWGDIFTLKEIKRNQINSTVTLRWEEPESNKTYTETYLIKDNELFIRTIVENMNKIGIDIKGNQFEYINNSIPSKEAIESILTTIAELEKLYNDNPTQELSKELKDLYEKIMEYYLMIKSDQSKYWMDKINIILEKLNQ